MIGVHHYTPPPWEASTKVPFQPPRVDVYDSKNPDRLLGSILRPNGDVRGREWCVAVFPPMRTTYPPYPHYDFCTDISRVYFRYGQKPTDGGWMHATVFHTDAPLALLLSIRDFRLPGESERQAAERNYSR